MPIEELTSRRRETSVSQRGLSSPITRRVGVLRAAKRVRSSPKLSIARISRAHVGVMDARMAQNGVWRNSSMASSGNFKKFRSPRVRAWSRSPAWTASSKGARASPPTGPPSGIGGS